MNFAEVIELHRTVATFCVENLDDRPKLGVYDIQSKDQGYFLSIKTNSNNNAFHDFLRSIAKARKLEIRNFRGYLIIHSVGVWGLHEN